LAPGIRVGWLVAPAGLKDRVLELKRIEDLQSNGIAQRLLEEWLDQTDYDAHLQRARSLYAERARVLYAALRKHFPTWRFSLPQGGFGIWLETPFALDDKILLERAIAEGVSFDPGNAFLRTPSTRCFLRVCYSLSTSEQLTDGVERLTRAVARPASAGSVRLRNAVR
jgi:2-aminoadipate transaminase